MRRALSLVLAALVIHLALILPDRPAAPGVGAVPAELPLVLAALAIAGRGMRAALTLLLAMITVLKLSDLTMIAVTGRPFDPLADLTLLDATLRLIRGSLGLPVAVLAATAAVLLAALIVLALWWAGGQWSGLARNTRQRVAALLLATLAALPGLIVTGATTSEYVFGRAKLLHQTRADLRDLRAAAGQDPFAGQQGLLSGIDRDVLVVFVESYGRSSFRAPFYAAQHVPTLRRAEADLTAAGLAMRSGFLVAPTQGGQSWLAHASFADGLRIGDQASYRVALASPRKGLFHYARQAGFTTAAVMPAITGPWPEGRAMGFDRVLGAADLGYRGKPFDWVTMPDQFTLTALDRLRAAEPRPIFAQVALISSHAPWARIPRLLPWERIADGHEFDAMASEGEDPESLWRDPGRVRQQYRAALDYALTVVMDYARLHAADPPLIFVLGDHPTAPAIALDAGHEVPLHVIGPAALVDRTAAWGLAPGLIPADDARVIPMERMRDLILGSFGAQPCAAANPGLREIC